MNTTAHIFKSGFVAIVGAPNSGKSTLLNRLLGEKISITSQKPQTTRNRILGILHLENSQCIFIDTPGIFKASGPLNTRIVDVAASTLQEVDIVLLLVDASQSDSQADDLLLGFIKDVTQPVVLALNKIDLVKKGMLLSEISKWKDRFDFKEIVLVSAQTGEQIQELIDSLVRLLPDGPPFYPEDSLTDVTERFIVSELIREKIIRQTGQEIPYSVAVTVDEYIEDPASPVIKILATIHVERDSQKGIIIGKGGLKLKSIGEAARKSIENLLGSRVYLKLFVRVEKNWSKDTKALEKFGY